MAEKTPVRWQTALFSRLVTEITRAAPLTVAPATPCGVVVARMRDSAATSATVVDAEGRPVGIVTERDVTRRLAFQADPDTPVARVMTGPLRTIPETEYLFHAIARMRHYDLRHMPVVDREGRLVGMANLVDGLVVAAGRLMERIHLLTDAGTVESLRDIKTAQAQLAAELLEDSLSAPEVLAFLTRVN
ncbi:MAG: CBS domain-containing protein, partial [Rhodobacterales bacterium]|nr:CBS domain-containing protein [Rhodobacterales bacterium]